MSTLAWYVHHVGQGHAARALALAAASPVPVTLVSELDLSTRWPDTVRLPPDAPAVGGEAPAADPTSPAEADPTAGGRLHWAPVDPARLTVRTAAMVEVLARPGLVGLVTDVSVEAGLLARLCGVPVVAVHELGRRHDPAHELGRACAAGLLLPYPEALADPTVDPAHPHQRHTGFVPAGTPAAAGERERARSALGLGEGPVVVVALGAGGTAATARALDDLAAALPGTTVVAVGDVPGAAGGVREADRLRLDGWVPDLRPHLLAADVVVAAAGASLVAEVAALRRPLVCVPEARPFAEQHERARRLAAVGAAEVAPGWDDRHALAAAVDRAAAAGGTGWDRIAPGPSPTAAMEWVLGRLDRRAVVAP